MLQTFTSIFCGHVVKATGQILAVPKEQPRQVDVRRQGNIYFLYFYINTHQSFLLYVIYIITLTLYNYICNKYSREKKRITVKKMSMIMEERKKQRIW
jgi:hypothetical protein